MMTTGERIKERRIELGLSADRLAEKLVFPVQQCSVTNQEPLRRCPWKTWSLSLMHLTQP